MPTLENASVQYGDMKGTAALDFHGSGGDIFELAKHIGAKGIPVAMELGIGLDVKTNQCTLLVTIYATEDADDAASVMKVSKEKGHITTKKTSASLPMSDFHRFFKRYEVVLTRKGYDGIRFEY